MLHFVLIPIISINNHSPPTHKGDCLCTKSLVDCKYLSSPPRHDTAVSISLEHTDDIS
ncbi:hypothetical protein HanRHA438_Chr11g0496931 [Helianthus annuus]|nr:hypothetical protein HanRHA438_Chr11g0496931 [Helianthus annuus]